MNCKRCDQPIRKGTGDPGGRPYHISPEHCMVMLYSRIEELEAQLAGMVKLGPRDVVSNIPSANKDGSCNNNCDFYYRIHAGMVDLCAKGWGMKSNDNLNKNTPGYLCPAYKEEK